jgi:hypothetical protein
MFIIEDSTVTAKAAFVVVPNDTFFSGAYHVVSTLDIEPSFFNNNMIFLFKMLLTFLLQNPSYL